ncbi:integral membrane protein [Colletotrichum higginsianum]|uniref:Integral membrane protein n=2 Tax=Colletotrichum higginsianum TaxID=80884 RepID=H1VIV0_COLHI|nr:Integral membrane protein [Colletotrichum higginsianum IMI 349063]OBR13193.1 Integral membrane protein [Colletotrichum higginsianum IMI 349063]TID01623.1 hypothetical protein CH35J_003446 [Colletotrichum higginsianum]CCF40153.1 integral membrane protein [Colletotrichum higginsianum]
MEFSGMKSWVARSEEGERLSDIAHNLPPIPVAGLSSVIQIVTYILSALATLVIALRIYVRLKLSGTERTWGWDDTFAVAGWAPLWPSVAFLIIATRWGLGARDAQVPEGMLAYYQIRVKEDMFYFEVIYFASSILTKLAMAVMILRLSSTRVYAYIIWGNMVVLGTNGFICMVIMFVSCSPIPALWNEKLGYCRMPQGWMLVSYAGSVVLAMVDWTCAVTPFFMLQGLQMPKRRKISLQVILSLGIIGSAAGLVRMGYYHAYDTKAHPHESLYNWGHTVLWSVLEACLGIIACSLPPLRKLFASFYPSSQGKSGDQSRGTDVNPARVAQNWAFSQCNLEETRSSAEKSVLREISLMTCIQYPASEEF